MKIHIGKEFPAYFRPAYPEEFELFSHFETAAAIPSVLFAVTTWKENGKPNVCLHAWSCFHGDKTAFFAVMGNLYQHTHTYANIRREGCFCVNFLPISCYDRLVETIRHNELDDDEFAVGGFTLAHGATVHAPVIEEAFVTLECTLREMKDLSGAGMAAGILVGETEADAKNRFAAEFRRQVVEPFARKHGSMACGDMVNDKKMLMECADFSAATKEQFEARPCLSLVLSACELTENFVKGFNNK